MEPGVTINILPATTITSTSAIGGCSSLSPSVYTVLAKGVCWSSVNTVPTLSDNYTDEFPSDPTANIFNSTMTGLTPNTLYYYRTYVTTTAPTPTTYSPTVEQFTTSSGPQDIGQRISADISTQTSVLATVVSSDISTQVGVLTTSILTDLSTQQDSLAVQISTQFANRHII